MLVIQVKLTKQRGGVRRSRKYQVSRPNTYLNYVYTECNDRGSKPVILKMEERKREVDSFGSIANSSSEQSLSLKDSRMLSKDFTTNSNYEWINTSTEPTTSKKYILSLEKKDVKEDSASVSLYDNVDSIGKGSLSQNDERMSENAFIADSATEHSKDSISTNIVTSMSNEPNQNTKEEEVGGTTCERNCRNGSNEATASGSNSSQENQRVGQ